MIPGAKRLRLDYSVVGNSNSFNHVVDSNNNTSDSKNVYDSRRVEDEDDSSSQCLPATSARDKTGTPGGKYQLRPRSLKARQCYDSDWNLPDTLKRSKPRAAPPLSRYRRKTANARERYRMRQINSAFESLRGVLPSWVCRRRAASELTKITTLRLASAYIRSLQDILDGSAHQDTCSWVLSSILENSYESQNARQHTTNKAQQFSAQDSELMSLLSGGASETGTLQEDLESSYLSPLPDADPFGLWMDNDPPRCWQTQQHTPLVT